MTGLCLLAAGKMMHIDCADDTTTVATSGACSGFRCRWSEALSHWICDASHIVLMPVCFVFASSYPRRCMASIVQLYFLIWHLKSLCPSSNSTPPQVNSVLGQISQNVWSFLSPTLSSDLTLCALRLPMTVPLSQKNPCISAKRLPGEPGDTQIAIVEAN